MITLLPIQPSALIPTKSGTKKWYQEPFAAPFGYANWPARTNKCTCRKFNPVDTTNLTKSGDAAAVLSVVDDTAALTAAGLIGICTSGKVYKLDNSVGVDSSYVIASGAYGNVNKHSISGYIRTNGVSGKISDSGGLVGDHTVFTTYIRQVIEDITPEFSTRQFMVQATAGSIIYFILPDLQEGAFITPPIFDPLNDSLTSITRAATNLTMPTAGVLPVNDFGIWGEVIPGASGQGYVHAFASHIADITATYITVHSPDTKVYFTKRIAGVNKEISSVYSYTLNTPFQYQAFQSRVYGMGIRVKQQGGAWSAWTLKNDADGRLDAPIASTYQVGARNNGSHFAGTYPGLLIGQHADPKAELERLTTLYGA